MKLYISIPESHPRHQEVARFLNTLGCEITKESLEADLLVATPEATIGSFNPQETILVGDFGLKQNIREGIICLDINTGHVKMPNDQSFHWQYYVSEFLIPLDY